MSVFRLDVRRKGVLMINFRAVRKTRYYVNTVKALGKLFGKQILLGIVVGAGVMLAGRAASKRH